MIKKIKSHLLTRLFIEWVNDEFNVETLETSKLMIQQRQDNISSMIDKTNPPQPIGFRY